MKKKIIFIMFPFLILNIIVNSQILNDDEKIKSYQSFKNLFKKRYQFTINKKHINVITDFYVDSKDRVIICDGWQNKSICIFTKNGKFLKYIGKKGNNVEIGEYATPVSLTTNGSDYYILDYLNRRILIYDKELIYVKNINLPQNVGHYLRLNKKNEYLFTYSAFSRSYSIQVFNLSGKLVGSFCPFPDSAKVINFFSSQNGFLLHEDFIYEMNPLTYNIRVFNIEGKQLNSFSRKVEFYSSPNLYDTKVNDFSKLQLLRGPFLFKNRFILVEVNNRLEVYNLKGEFINGGIELPGKIIHVNIESIYILNDTEKSHIISEFSLVN